MTGIELVATDADLSTGHGLQVPVTTADVPLAETGRHPSRDDLG
ncbi:hypothetical protein [Solicola gregarius]|nr:hypothetical protein [Solicola gregarius]